MHHIVGIGNLRVLIVPDENTWFAQGVEIDYGAQGDTIAEAKKNFEHGFFETIDLHLKMYGDLTKFLVFPPSEILQEASRNKHLMRLYSQVSTHEVVGAAELMLPFAAIEYLAMEAAA